MTLGPLVEGQNWSGCRTNRCLPVGAFSPAACCEYCPICRIVVRRAGYRMSLFRQSMSLVVGLSRQMLG